MHVDSHMYDGSSAPLSGDVFYFKGMEKNALDQG